MHAGSRVSPASSAYAVVAKLTETLLEPVAESIDQTRLFIHQEIARSRELLQSVNFQPT